MAESQGVGNGTASATIRVGDEFALNGDGVFKGFSKDRNLPYIFVIKKADRGFASVKMFIHNAEECMNAQKIKVKKILDASASPRSVNGKFYTEFKITADCDAFDVYASERKRTGDEFESIVNSKAKPEGGLFDQYSDGNELPFV